MGLLAGGNYLSCLVIVVIFMGFGGAKRWRDSLKSSFGVGRQAAIGGRGAVFMEKGSSHYVILLF